MKILDLNSPIPEQENPLMTGLGPSLGFEISPIPILEISTLENSSPQNLPLSQSPAQCPPASLCCWETATICQHPSQMRCSLASQVASKLEYLCPWGPKPPEAPLEEPFCGFQTTIPLCLGSDHSNFSPAFCLGLPGPQGS